MYDDKFQFPQCFQKAAITGSLNSGMCGTWLITVPHRILPESHGSSISDRILVKLTQLRRIRWMYAA